MEAAWNCSSRCDSPLCLSHSGVLRQDSMEVLHRLCGLTRIIRDIQLMAMVAVLILGDLLVLSIWNLSDPIRCSRSLGAVVKLDKDVSYSMSQLDSCSSMYSDLWVFIIVVKKACLLLYGTYLAGLTSDVSRPPVNQSPTILTAASLVTLCSGVAVPVSLMMPAWPNVVCGTVAGAIFICTLATDCMLFVPQLTEWRHFEEDHNNPSQMAKYFSSPAKSQPSVYSQDDIYFLLGENNSMKQLLNEKNAVIDSLQEQVSNAKDKLLRLVSASQQSEEEDNLQLSSTQATQLQCANILASHSDVKSDISPSPTVFPRLVADSLSLGGPGSFNCPPLPSSVTPVTATSPLSGELDGDPSKATTENPLRSSGCLRTAEETAHFVTSLQSPGLLNHFETLSNGPTSPSGPNTKPAGFVSSEKLQEILQELSIDTVLETVLKSARSPSNSRFTEDSSFSPISLQTPRSPTHPPLIFRYPSISPYAMRKRRPPFHSPRRRRLRAGRQNLTKHPERVTSNGSVTAHGTVLRVPDCDFDLQDEEGSLPTKSYGCSPENINVFDVETVGDAQDSRKYWDSDSSSSTDYCYYHRPYCDSCLQRGSLLTSDSSDSSDSEYESNDLYRSAHPVVFKEDLKPTFV
ncbi:probable G-protein coupled receptor 156 isoform X2 [Corythoichthys intestinalis]|uniref:probable G-protein coupled receptor 156 isoform X2 n=1 Tax=Corythoichthys intestinalis TaxID=161448 RepID=UPI0025A54C71|nr:probable G-protein coupled receptor 156 isoform X2 [Corythoichthys intestinalis]